MYKVIYPIKNIPSACALIFMRFPVAQLRARYLTFPLGCLLLAPGFLLAQSNSPALAMSEVQVETYTISDWLGFTTNSTLNDGTHLYRYVTQVSAANPEQKETPELIRFTFVPRFNCTPLIAIMGSIPEDTGNIARADLLRQYGQLSLDVDGTSIDYPSMVENQGSIIYSYYNVNLEKRNTFRILIERGSVVTMRLADKPLTGDGQSATAQTNTVKPGVAVKFSLTGSKRAIQQALARCRNHSGN